MYKVYFQDIKPIEVDKMSDVINYLVCHNAIGYEKLNNKSAYEVLEEKYKKALKEKNKYKKIVNKFESFLFNQLQEYGGGGFVQEYYNKLKELKDEDKIERGQP
jgi:hypothetical protein